MKSLHIVRKIDDLLAREVIADEALTGTVALLLIQDGVLAKGDFPDETYVCQEDLAARGGQSPHVLVNYPGIVRLITECERVIVW